MAIVSNTYATLAIPTKSGQKTAASSHDHLSFPTAIIIAINNNDVAKIRQLLKLDPGLFEDYTAVIEYLNITANDFACLSRAEQLRRTYFTDMLNQHLAAKRAMTCKISLGYTACILGGLLLGSLTTINRAHPLQDLMHQAVDCLHNPQIYGSFGVTFVSIELGLLALRTFGVKSPFFKEHITHHSLLMHRLNDATFDFFRIAARYTAYSIMLGVGASLAPLSMSLLLVGETIGVCKHIFNWHFDRSHTRRSLEANIKEARDLDQRFKTETDFNEKQCIAHRKFQLQNANDMLEFDLTRKRAAIKVSAVYGLVLLAAYATILFVPGGAPVIAAAIAIVVLASIWKSRQLKKIDHQQDDEMTARLQKNEENYRATTKQLYLESGTTEPKVTVELRPKTKEALLNAELQQAMTNPNYLRKTERTPKIHSEKQRHTFHAETKRAIPTPDSLQSISHGIGV